MMIGTRLLPLLAVLIAPFCGSAQAMDYEVGSSIVCDTIPGRTLRRPVLRRYASDHRRRQCRGENPTACALIDAAYLRGPEIGVARNGDSVFEIVRILVGGIDTAAAIRMVRPSAYFSLFGVKEYAV
jgi:hypothetical protein